MLEDLQQLVGFRLEACRFSRGSYSFEFDGTLNGEHASVVVSTSHQLASDSGELLDLEASVSQRVWPLLEEHVKSIAVSQRPERDEAVFTFPNGALVFWAERPSEGELLMVNNRFGSEWSVFL